jgi:hypothetical protein
VLADSLRMQEAMQAVRLELASAKKDYDRARRLNNELQVRALFIFGPCETDHPRISCETDHPRISCETDHPRISYIMRN